MNSVRVILRRVLEAYDFTEGQLPEADRTDDTVIDIYVSRDDIETARGWLTGTDLDETTNE